jgi:hypothetical protein
MTLTRLPGISRKKPSPGMWSVTKTSKLTGYGPGMPSMVPEMLPSGSHAAEIDIGASAPASTPGDVRSAMASAADAITAAKAVSADAWVNTVFRSFELTRRCGCPWPSLALHEL